MDLSTMKSAHAGAQALLALGVECLDILVTNAAVNAHGYHVNEDGLVSHMVVTYFGHLFLTQTLLPLMEPTLQLPGADVRIITVGSSAYKVASSDRRFDSLEAMNAGLEGVSKLAQSLWARELARRLAERRSTITSVVIDSGLTWSEGAQARMAEYPAPVRWLFRAPTRTPEVPAETLLWAVRAPRECIGGRSVSRAMITGSVGVERWGGLVADGVWEPLARELWETSERIVIERLHCSCP
ncbi:hypothetical protein AURDEDRAFT_166729 [Auricularia subglabra TFB-10046 SS5]|nr:hypothetical protein AURDEDRAFT_166729 [Auricularia subglabra TFB-10046 SS5]